MGSWFWVVMADISTGKLHRSFLSYFLNYNCCKSVLFLNVAVVYIQNADNYQNCSGEWRWKNISWQVSIHICPFNRVLLI